MTNKLLNLSQNIDARDKFEWAILENNEVSFTYTRKIGGEKLTVWDILPNYEYHVDGFKKRAREYFDLKESKLSNN